MFHKKCFMKKCFLSECPGLKHGFWFATCLANLSAQTLLLQRGNMFQNWWQNSLRDFFDVCICKCTRFPDGNLLFLSLFSLSKNWMHNVGWGCALVLVKKSELSDIPKLQNFGYLLLQYFIQLRRLQPKWVKRFAPLHAHIFQTHPIDLSLHVALKQAKIYSNKDKIPRKRTVKKYDIFRQSAVTKSCCGLYQERFTPRDF